MSQAEILEILKEVQDASPEGPFQEPDFRKLKHGCFGNVLGILHRWHTDGTLSAYCIEHDWIYPIQEKYPHLSQEDILEFYVNLPLASQFQVPLSQIDETHYLILEKL